MKREREIFDQKKRCKRVRDMKCKRVTILLLSSSMNI